MTKNSIKIIIGILSCTLLMTACSNRHGGSGKKIVSEKQVVKSSRIVWDKTSVSDFDYEYDPNLKGVSVRYKGSASKVRFPNKINGDPVVVIDQIKTPDVLEAAYIPSSVKKLGPGAFDSCSSLKHITIPDSVTEIGFEAFQGCSSLRNINIPKSVTAIDDGAFAHCSEFTSVVIPDSVKRIGGNAFACCTKLVNITFPNSVDSIDINAGAFRDTYWYEHHPNGLIRIGNTILDYKGYGEGPTTITIPEGVTCISDESFSNGGGNMENLKSVKLPSSLKKIGDKVFYECDSLDEPTKRSILKINPKITF